MKTAQELRSGNVIMVGADPLVVQKAEYNKSGRNAAVVKLKFKNLLTGSADGDDGLAIFELGVGAGSATREAVEVRAGLGVLARQHFAGFIGDDVAGLALGKDLFAGCDVTRGRFLREGGGGVGAGSMTGTSMDSRARAKSPLPSTSSLPALLALMRPVSRNTSSPTATRWRATSKPCSATSPS